ncbi:hypothetical protein AJ79_08164 [Helicocarpus griseus UAMH5409]|uniref:Mid2 domain-containing protein n=1 Tax=Helicocarpus griseus UAMH5409 TaxID=1447875 RepID=A0A2B7WVM9_9EURO|nr:hypothetical protein AJ79_08164 [Helicocarpus griseus UAMH5409]
MRRLTISWAALAALATISQSPLTQAIPFPIHFNTGLASRDCTPCGFYGQACCTASQTCSTNFNNQAVCLDSASSGPRDTDGQWETYTTTFVQTDLVTVTSTGSRLIAAPTGGNRAQCELSLGESPCGSICCSAAQACKSEGQCVEAGSSPFESTPGPSPTPPYRPTSSGDATITAGPTATVPFIPPVGTDGNALPPPEAQKGGGGLSGGAIAGIVIGVLAGIVLLFLICLSACAKGAISAILALFGLGKKRGSSASGSTHSFTDDGRPGRTWFGHRPTRPPRSDTYSYYSSEKSKKSGLFGLGKWTSVGLILGALAICLGLRSKKKKTPPPPSSVGYTDSYYYYDYSSSSSSSSDPRSKRSKRARSKSRSSRPSRPSRR